MTSTGVPARKMILRATLVAVVSALAFFLALVSVPAIAESSGIAPGYVSIVLAGIALVGTLAATRWTRSLNRKKPAE
jgi:hypothetical protein